MHTKYRWQMEKEWRDRNSQIISMRLDKMTYREIGECFGISQERVRQIINKHHRELRNGPVLRLRSWWAICCLLSEHTTLEILRLPGVGRTTLREVVYFMHRRGFWRQYNENGIPIGENHGEGQEQEGIDTAAAAAGTG